MFYQILVVALVLLPTLLYAGDPPPLSSESLLKTGQELAEKGHFLEALNLLEQARDILEIDGPPETPVYAEVLYALAETKIKGRLYQNFPAHYVKTALQDIQAANKLRERLPDIIPYKIAEGYYLEGYIQKTFFMRMDQARACFEKATKVDPGFAAAKRELSELIPLEESSSK